ncbi:MAG: hypothetical protein RMH74_06230, partial [Candidatus Caldarchaeum sp.]|nr:hypothetical protein [Candidatus Caldarchaeum sp.]
EYRKRLSAERKKLREELKARYGWAEMDGKKFEVANWMVEPPGIFMGRGAHPLRGQPVGSHAFTKRTSRSTSAKMHQSRPATGAR